MLSKFSALDLFLWFAAISMQLLNIALAWSGGFRSTHRAFTIYLTICLTVNTVLTVAARCLGTSAYHVILIVGSSADSVAMVAVLAEMWRRTIGPQFTLPDWVLTNYLKSMIVAALITWPLAFLLDLAIGSHPFSGFVQIFSTMEEIVCAVILTSLVVILLYARELGLRVRTVDAGIASGFILCLSAGLVTDAVRRSATTEAAMVAQRVLQFVYCATLAIWTRSIRYREPAEKLASRDEIRLQSDKLRLVERELELRA